MTDDSATNNFADEADDTRERIAATIDQLQDRLNPRRIVGDAVGSMQSSGANLMNSGGRLLQDHPVAAIAAVIGIGVAVLGRGKLQRATVDLGDEHESYSDFEDDYRAGSGASQRFALTRQGAGGTIEENPVVAIVLGLAAGALLGYVFPETAKERELLGASSDRLKAAARAAAGAARDELSTARNKVGDVATHAKSAVQSVVGAAKQELQDRS
jgi:ElaB/YqjD/DUF883 family membrane-anchored ribosome-binding protein